MKQLNKEQNKNGNNKEMIAQDIGGSLLTSLFTFLLICIGLYVQKETELLIVLMRQIL